ncbi:MAG: hypothetical protein KBG47_06790 [Bacteroidia bacterium]|nr:hypothetical protein [Bacteroidia bacterium]
MDTPEHIQQLPKPKRSFLGRLFRFVFWIAFILVILVITAISLVYIYEDDVKAIIIKELNKNLNAEIRLDPTNIDLTIIKTFPDCALEFKNIACMEAIKSEKRDTLVFAKSLQLKFDIKDLWNKKYDIKKIKMTDAFCRLKVNSKGKPNYIVWKQSTDTIDSNDSLKFNLEQIEFVNVNMSYADLQYKVRTQFNMKQVDLSGNFSDTDYELKGEGDLYVNKVSVNKTDYINNKNVKYKAELQVRKDLYKIKTCDAHLNKMHIETNGMMVYGDSLSELDLAFKGMNLDIQSVLSLLPESQKDRIRDYKSEGNFYVNGKMKYKKDYSVNVDFGVSNTTVVYQPKDAKLTNLNAKGKFVSSKDQTLLELKNVSGDLISDHFYGDLALTNFNDPYLDLKVGGTLDLENFTKFWPIDTISKLKGKITFNGLVKSKVEELKRNMLSENASLELQASLKNLVIQFKKQRDSTNIYSCELRALDRLVEVKDLSIKKGRSDLKINGKVEGAFNYILDDKNPLKIHGDLRSERIVVEDFIYDEASATKKSEVDVPDNINFILDASIDALSFGKFNAAKLQGNIELKNKKIMAESLNLNTMDGNATIDALLDLNGKNLEVSMHGEMAKINVSKLFAQLNNFDQETLKDNNVGGLLSASIDFSGTWNKFLEPDLNSMKAISDLQIEQGRLVDFKPLESLAKFVDINDLKSIKFSSLQSRVEISKSIITIPKTAIKNSALNIDFWGTHSFNNDIDYHIQLLIGDYLNKKRKPDADYEFALVENDPENRRSAFILMTGTVDKPIIKYDRKGMKQKIKEDIKNEKQNLKAILKEEFGMFKKDSIKVKTTPKSDQQFKLEDPKKKKDPEKEEEDEDF